MSSRTSAIGYPLDFERFSERAINNLKELIRRANEEENGFDSLLLSRSSAMERWCIKFTALLILKGGGQRPQVYGTIRCPTASEIEAMLDSARKGGFFRSPQALKSVRDRLGLLTLLFCELFGRISSFMSKQFVLLSWLAADGVRIANDGRNKRCC